MTISRSFTLPINVMLIFEMHDVNGALFLNATFLSALLFSFAAAAKISIACFKQYMHRYSHINLTLASNF